jgi:hypothetical protein
MRRVNVEKYARRIEQLQQHLEREDIRSIPEGDISCLVARADRLLGEGGFTVLKVDLKLKIQGSGGYEETLQALRATLQEAVCGLPDTKTMRIS